MTKDTMAEHHRAALLSFIWRSYTHTIDNRSKAGDVEMLAEAAERNDWAGSPEIGVAIAALLRKAYCNEVKSPPGDSVLRDREIVELAETLGASHATIADIYGIDPRAVSKVIQRKRKG